MDMMTMTADSPLRNRAEPCGADGCLGSTHAHTNRLSGVSCIDLFCGAGGLTHGFRMEGLPVNAGIDLDPACRYPYERNNGATFVEQDITALAADDVAALFTPNTIRVLAGCAPCQPFSTYSQRYDTRRDGKWSLLYEFCRITEHLRPDVVTMENVPTIARHQVFADFVGRLRALGYSVWSDVVNCADYGVPQHRRRMVLLASLQGPLALPGPTYQHHRTVRDVIGHMPPIAAGGESPFDNLHTSSGLSAINLARIRASTPGGSWREWPAHLVADCHKAATGSTYPSVYGRMEWDKPAPSITTQCHGFGNGRFGHPSQDRAISLREAAILQGFPYTYRFVRPGESVQFSVIGRLIGNAVPVDLGRAIARSIVAHLSNLRSSGLVRNERLSPCAIAENTNMP